MQKGAVMICVYFDDKESIFVYCNGKKFKKLETSEYLLIDNAQKVTLEFFTKESSEKIEKYYGIKNTIFLIDIFTEGILFEKLKKYKFFCIRCTVAKQENIIIKIVKDVNRYKIEVSNPESAIINYLYGIPLKLQIKFKLLVFLPLIILCLGLFSFYVFMTFELVRSLSAISIIVILALTIGIFFLIKQMFVLYNFFKK